MAGSFSAPFHNFGVNNLQLFVNVQDFRHLAFELRIAAFHIVKDFVWPDLSLRQDPMQLELSESAKSGTN